MMMMMIMIVSSCYRTGALDYDLLSHRATAAI